MKNGPACRQSGFTLVELLISIALVTILIASGTSVALKAGQRKQVEQAGRDFQGTLEQARANALAGKKENCNFPAGQTLAGWGVTIPEGGTSFTLDEWCGNVYLGRNKNILNTKRLPTGITMNRPTEFPIIFKPLGQGIWSATNPFPASVRVTVSGFGFSKDVVLYRSGEISAP